MVDIASRDLEGKEQCICRTQGKVISPINALSAVDQETVCPRIPEQRNASHRQWHHDQWVIIKLVHLHTIIPLLHEQVSKGAWQAEIMNPVNLEVASRTTTLAVH